METPDRATSLRILNIAATLLTILINILANSLPLNGVTTGEISDRYPVYFVPAGYVFSIWGLIYIGLLAFSIYQFLPGESVIEDVRRIGYRYALGCLGNILWLFFWHYGVLALTPIPMLVLLITLISTYTRLGIGKRTITRETKWMLHVPFSIYLGWITVATVANISTVLYAAGWHGSQFWAFLMMLVAAGLAVVAVLTRRDLAYTLVIAWALLGIAVKQGGTTLVSPAALVLTIVLVVLCFVVALGPTGDIPITRR